jgi:uncharacterized membrane protein
VGRFAASGKPHDLAILCQFLEQRLRIPQVGGVYDRRGERLGSIHSVMIDKISGKVAYAVMSFGGFLAMGDSYHPLPWHVLTYRRPGQGSGWLPTHASSSSSAFASFRSAVSEPWVNQA